MLTGKAETAIRLLQIAIRIRSWSAARSLNRYLDNCWLDTSALRQKADRLYLNDTEIQQARAWVWLRNFLHARRVEAVCRAIRPLRDEDPIWVHHWIVDRTQPVGSSTLIRYARLLAAADLRLFDREDDAFGPNPYDRAPGEMSFGTEDESVQERLQLIDRFVRRSDAAPWDVDGASLFLCTRPPSYSDIAKRVVSWQNENGFAVDTFERILEFVNAIRGTKYVDPDAKFLDNRTVQLQGRRSPFERRYDPLVILGMRAPLEN